MQQCAGAAAELSQDSFLHALCTPGATQQQPLLCADYYCPSSVFSLLKNRLCVQVCSTVQHSTTQRQRLACVLMKC